ncbi:MAG: hypothetical protein ABFD89_10375 [Bryobacteraceae bacterium]
MAEPNPNPFRVTTRVRGLPPSTSVCCAVNFIVSGIGFEVEAECTDPELTALIDAYVSRKAREWQEWEAPDA